MRTLLDRDNNRPRRRTALVAHELSQYNIDIAALSETRFEGEGSLSEVGEGYTFFWRGVEPGTPRNHGVGFAVRTKLLQQFPESPSGMNERIMTWRIPLAKNRYATLISAYAPTLDADESIKNMFYEQLDQFLATIPISDKVLLLGDFNARVGQDQEIWNMTLGAHGVGKMNENGLRLLSICTEHSLAITNTFFQLPNKYKTSWQHPRSRHWHLIDYVITRQRDIKDFLITRAMRGADCETDHRLIRSKVLLKIRPLQRRQAPTKKLDIPKLKSPETTALYRNQLANLLLTDTTEETPTDATTLWQSIHNAVITAATDTVGYRQRRHKDWFDDNSVEITQMIETKRQLHNAHLQNPNSHRIMEQLKEMRAEVQRRLRVMENNWWLNKSKELQMHADTNNTHAFYDSIKTIYGPSSRTITPVKTSDGNTLLKEKQEILNRWAEHFSTLLNHHNEADINITESLPQLMPLQVLDETPTFIEVIQAVKRLKDNKSPGPDGIAAELLKKGGYALKLKLHELVCKIWHTGEVPQDLKDSAIITIYKRKGDKSICGNSRGVSLLATAGKAVALIMQNRLLKHLTEDILPESQCGFRKDRSTADMIFCLRQLQEKAVEHNQSLYIAFIDLAKAFDTVCRELLWKVLAKVGVPPKFLCVLKSLHEGMKSFVSMGDSQSDPFQVEAGVKQGCVLAPILFNIFLMAVSYIFHLMLQNEEGIQLQYRLDGSLFNLRRLQAQTKPPWTQS